MTATPTVAVVATGEMGAAVASVLRHSSLEVITALEGRSGRTRALAALVGIEDAGSIEKAARRADIFLSIVPPGQAVAVAEAAAKAAARGSRDTQLPLVYIDFNAISPTTTMRMGARMVAAGLTFVDGGIIGFPPRPGSRGTHFWISGPELERSRVLREYGLQVNVAGDRWGQASALKMSYAAITKGLTAVGMQSFTAAAAAGLLPLLLEELRDSQPALLPWLERMLTTSPPKAYRWVAEMREIAETFAAAGFSPELFEGAAATYAQVAQTALGKETPEARQQRSVDSLAHELAKAVQGIEVDERV